MTLDQAVNEAARIVYKCHDENKDKDFELEMAWIGPQTKGGKGQVEMVPKEMQAEAERLAKEALDADMED